MLSRPHACPAYPSPLPQPIPKVTPIATTPFQHLPQSFFARPAELVAPQLIGCLLVKRQEGGELLWGVVVETEAYSQDDSACHGYRRRTPNNSIRPQQQSKSIPSTRVTSTQRPAGAPVRPPTPSGSGTPLTPRHQSGNRGKHLQQQIPQVLIACLRGGEGR